MLSVRAWQVGQLKSSTDGTPTSEPCTLITYCNVDVLEKALYWCIGSSLAVQSGEGNSNRVSSVWLVLVLVSLWCYAIQISLPRAKMNCLVRFGNCFLRVALMYQPSCLLPCCQGKPGELAKKTVIQTSETVHFVSWYLNPILRCNLFLYVLSKIHPNYVMYSCPVSHVVTFFCKSLFILDVSQSGGVSYVQYILVNRPTHSF